MSLDVYLEKVMPTEVFEANITHNLAPMAEKADIYECLWRPDEHGYKYASDLIPVLEKGLELLRSNPEEFRILNPPNGWGTYDGFVPWVERYLAACKEHPDATIRVSR